MPRTRRKLPSVFAQAVAAVGLAAVGACGAQDADDQFVAGQPLASSPNAKTFGSFRFAESISYDAERDLYVIVNAGIAQDLQPNDGYVSLLNPDGSVHTLKWIGVNRNGLTLNHPLGSDINGGRLYVADGNVVRWFDMATGAPAGNVEVSEAGRFNDIEVADDGTVYATQSGSRGEPDTWAVYRIQPNGTSSVFVQGAPLNVPNGVAFDNDGNVVVVNIGTDDVLTFSPSGELLMTEHTVDAGNDGLVILEDGTKYVSSVIAGTVSKIEPGQDAEVVAYGIPTAASMAYDSRRNRLLIPMNNWDAMTIVELD